MAATTAKGGKLARSIETARRRARLGSFIEAPSRWELPSEQHRAQGLGRQHIPPKLPAVNGNGAQPKRNPKDPDTRGVGHHDAAAQLIPAIDADEGASMPARDGVDGGVGVEVGRRRLEAELEELKRAKEAAE